mmetsp:Transcript_46661/g.117552  ORF Transcript_46661/g.117552 Transcript_46661/m.117552 type:complete len:205 (-) Transcript_46661:35-649(-)
MASSGLLILFCLVTAALCEWATLDGLEVADNWVTAAERNDLLALENYHTENVAVDACRKKDGWTALHVAASKRNLKLVERLLEWGADVNVESYNGVTPLHLAVRSGDATITNKLLEKKAIFKSAHDTENGIKGTPLSVALRLGHSNLVSILKQYAISLKEAGGEPFEDMSKERAANAKERARLLAERRKKKLKTARRARAHNEL